MDLQMIKIGYANYAHFSKYGHIGTVYVVYLAVALIWRFSESVKHRQIKCMPFRL